MKTKKIKITIGNLEDSFKESRKFFSDLDKGIVKKQIPKLNFENFKICRKILTHKRLELLRVIRSNKLNSIKDLVKITNRDFKNIYDDIKMLESLDLVKLKKSKLGLIPCVVYDEVDIDIKIPLEVV